MELARSTSRGGYSVRSVFMFVLTVLMTVLLWTVLASTPTHAAEANWNGETILFSGDQYYTAGEANGTESHGLADGTTYYLHIETISERPQVRKAHVIYFAPGNSPPTATSAEYVVYDYSPDQQFSNPQNQETIDMVPQGEQVPWSSCAVEGGLGWVICPLTVTLAGAMDWIFEQIAQFVAVPPTQVNDTESDLYVAWNVMRSIANIAFIIAFLIIIYSQITNLGISNYGLKKLVPRLIVAALLVNLSFLITAIAVDLSNVIGYSLQDILIQLRQDTFNIDNATYADEVTAGDITASTSDWGSVTGVILSGGAAVGAYAALAAGTAGSLSSLVYFIVPLLLGLLLTLLFVLLVLAARQAIIIILIIVAPLAFVAYLLPNTEKWFEKWRELFMTMLLFFPAFALVFGGSQLAGGIIIQNAYGAGSFIMVIFGMAVQVAPLVITPLLLKLSGGLLGRIAGMINDPRKGLMDRTRNWSKERAEMQRLNSLRKQGGFAFGLRKTARRMDNSNRRVKERTALYTAMNDNRYNKTRGHEQLHEQEALTKLEHDTIENRLGSHIETKKNIRGSAMNLKAVELEASKVDLEDVTASTDAMYAEYRSGRYDTGSNQRLNELQRTMARQVIDTAVQRQRQQSAQNMQTQSFADAIKASVDLQAKAGGVDPKGAQRALAAALAAQSKAHSEAIANAGSILSHYNYGDDVVTNIALGRGEGLAINITDDIREAAIAQIAGGGNTDEIMRLMENLEINPSEDNQDFRQTFAEKLLANSNKPKFAGAGILAAMKQGDAPAAGKPRLDDYIARTINDDKIASAELLVTQDKSYLWRVLNTMQNNESGVPIDDQAMMKILKSIKEAKSEPDFAGRIGERAKAIDAMQEELLGRFGLSSLDDVADD